MDFLLYYHLQILPPQVKVAVRSKRRRELSQFFSWSMRIIKLPYKLDLVALLCDRLDLDLERSGRRQVCTKFAQEFCSRHRSIGQRAQEFGVDHLVGSCWLNVVARWAQIQRKTKSLWCSVQDRCTQSQFDQTALWIRTIRPFAKRSQFIVRKIVGVCACHCQIDG